MFDFIDDSGGDNLVYAQDGLYIPDAAECMRCGLCLSVCPTYQLLQIDAETPRGRLRTLDKILNSDTAVAGGELKHLNNCTQCRACETVCPSRMQYGRLFDLAREKQLQGKRRGSLLAFLGLKLIEHKPLRQAAIVLVRLYQKTGLHNLTRKTGLLRLFKLARAEALMPEANTGKLARRYRTDKPRRGNVALFTGCVGEHFDRKTLLASITLLNYIGFDVFIPEEQTCCGAIHRHQGKIAVADKMASLNADVFNALDVEAIIYTASGCGLTLNDYEQDNGARFGPSLCDITEFLNRHWPDELRLNSYPRRARKIAVHEPCSQRNLSRPELGNQHQHVYALLEKIPGLIVAALPGNHLCCGAGGVHMLTHPDIADPLGQAKLTHFEQSGADWLVSTNIGCVLHLNKGSALNRIIHPAVLLAKMLPEANGIT